MRWKKLGHIYAPDGKLDWAQTHAYLPYPYILDKDTIRVFCSFLDKEKIGRIGFVDLDSNNITAVKRISKTPVLDIGETGMFDEHGVNPVSLVKTENELRLYYIGWQRLKSVPYLILTGLAVSKDNGESFTRLYQTPILERSPEEPFLRSCGTVMQENNLWKMWYGCGKSWIETPTGKLPWYEIRYLESPDGITWGSRGQTCLSPAGNDEFGFARAFIFHEDSYFMLSSARSKSLGYRFAGAISQDGVNWQRKDDLLEIDVSAHGWDSQMVCFPTMLKINNKTFLFYNGNRYGETGFGAAELINEY